MKEKVSTMHAYSSLRDTNYGPQPIVSVPKHNKVSDVS